MVHVRACIDMRIHSEKNKVLSIVYVYLYECVYFALHVCFYLCYCVCMYIIRMCVSVGDTV